MPTVHHHRSQWFHHEVRVFEPARAFVQPTLFVGLGLAKPTAGIQ